MNQPQYAQLPYPPPARKRPRRWPWVLLGMPLGMLVMLVVIGAIGAIGAVNSGTDGAVSNPVVSPAEAPAAAQQDEGPVQPEVATFGQRYTWESGVAIEVAAPAPYTPSASAANHSRDRAIVVTTTIVNGSDKPFQFNEMMLGPNATHGGETAPKIIDLGQDLGVVPLTTILPGKSFTYRIAFSIGKAPVELQLEYSEDFIGNPAIFVGEV